MQPAAGLGGDPVGDPSQAFEVIAHGLCREIAKILGPEHIEDSTQLADELLRGPIPPLPTLRTHVRIISNRARMSRPYLHKGPSPPAQEEDDLINARLPAKQGGEANTIIRLRAPPRLPPHRPVPRARLPQPTRLPSRARGRRLINARLPA